MLDQVSVSFTLRLATAMHTGTGEFSPLGELREGWPNLDGDETLCESLVATLARDHAGNPYLPSTTLKGCLRTGCQDAGWTEENIKELFGEITDHDKNLGQMGALLLEPGRLIADKVPIDIELPFYDQGKATYIATQVAIDGDTGGPLNGALYKIEMAPPGLCFSCRMVYLGAWDDQGQSLLSSLMGLLKHTGLSLGKGTTKGHGKLCLDSLGRVEYKTFNPIKFRVDRSEVGLPIGPPQPTAAKALSQQLELSCPGPFLVLDPYRQPPGVDQEEPERRNILLPEITRAGEPHLPGSSLMGALRSRLGWLMGLQALSQGRNDESDDPYRVLQPNQAPDILSTTQRLFGVTGWRGMVRIDSLELLQAGTEVSTPRVALDRFTCGPIDGALFFTRAFIGVEYRLEVSLEKRAGYGAESPDDSEAFEQLITSLESDGLCLGHGGNHGYGWFEVRRSAS